MKKHRLPHVSKAMIVTLLFASMQFACTKKQENGTVRIVMPSTPTTVSAKAGSTSTVAARSVSASSEGSSFNSSINPTTGSEINCFAVFIGGGDLAGNSCTVGTSAADATTIRFGPNVGFIPAGSAISIDTPPGPRMIYVVGLRAATTAACSNYSGEPDSANLSEPFLIASQPANIISGANTVAITAALNSSKKVLDCQFLNPGGGGGGGSGGGSPFGDKRDGSLTALSSIGSMQAGTTALASAATNHSGTSPLLPSKVVGASRRISNIASSGADAGRAITVATGFAVADFQAGDEVVWYVAGGARVGFSVDDPVNGACGGSLYTGRYGTARITTVPNTTSMVLDRPISGSPATIQNSHLTAPPTATDYCTLVLARVSSFDTITLAGGNNLTILAEPFDYTNGKGGIVMIRAETISVDSGSTLTISGSMAGFNGGVATGGPYQGQGLNGFGTITQTFNYNGGAPGNASTVGGGGGGQAGAGAFGVGAASTAGVGGSPLNHCMGGLPCKPLDDQKAFMAGGGGAAGTANGGAGGGVVLVFARNIIGNGIVTVEAKGGNGSAATMTGSGGGAGGTIGVVVQNRTVASLNLDAKGGNGGTSAANGGGGGGGVVNLHKCLATFTGSTFTNIPKGTNGVGGSSGVSATDIALACGIP